MTQNLCEEVSWEFSIEPYIPRAKGIFFDIYGKYAIKMEEIEKSEKKLVTYFLITFALIN